MASGALALQFIERTEDSNGSLTADYADGTDGKAEIGMERGTRRQSAVATGGRVVRDVSTLLNMTG